jgi:hypothetical protein
MLEDYMTCENFDYVKLALVLTRKYLCKDEPQDIQLNELFASPIIVPTILTLLESDCDLYTIVNLNFT